MKELPQMLPPDEMPERYYDTYCAVGQMRLSSRPHARQWYALGVPAETAGRWAAHGYPPADAWRLMELDFTPEMAVQLPGVIAAAAALQLPGGAQ